MKLNEPITKQATFSNILTVISLILAYYFYVAAEKEREPVYIINDSSIVIYNNTNTSGSIKLLTKDSVIIQDNVYLTEIVLWNDGNLPIVPEDVRDTLKLILQGVKEILDYKIVAESHTSSKFKVKQLDFNTLIIDWNYFDPSNAVKFQIIYLGDKILEPLWKVNILGVETIKSKKDSKYKRELLILIILSSFALPFFYI